MSFYEGQVVTTLITLESWGTKFRKGRKAIVTEVFGDEDHTYYEIVMTNKEGEDFYFSVDAHEIKDYTSSIPIEKRISQKLQQIYARQSFKFKES